MLFDTTDKTCFHRGHTLFCVAWIARMRRHQLTRPSCNAAYSLEHWSAKIFHTGGTSVACSCHGEELSQVQEPCKDMVAGSCCTWSENPKIDRLSRLIESFPQAFREVPGLKTFHWALDLTPAYRALTFGVIEFLIDVVQLLAVAFSNI